MIRACILLLCCFIFCVQVKAEVLNEKVEMKSFNLEQALEIALINNLGLKASETSLDVNQGVIRDAKRWPNPRLINDSGIAEDTYRAGVQQTFVLGGKIKNRTALAETRGKVISSEVGGTMVNLRYDVRKAYAGLYYAIQEKEIYKELLEIAKTTLKLAKAKTEAGKTTVLDSLNAELAFANLENIYRTIDYRVKSEKNKLERILNQPIEDSLYEPPTPLALENLEELGDKDIDELIQIAFEKRPELQGVLYRQEESDRLLDLAKSNRIPDLSVAVGPDIVVPGSGDAGGSAINVFVFAEMELPLFYRQQGKIQEAKALRTKMEYLQKDLENEIIMEVKNAYNAYKLNKELMGFYKSRVLVTAKDFVDKSQESYLFGKVSIIITLRATQELKKISLNYVKASLDYQKAIADLEKALGIAI